MLLNAFLQVMNENIEWWDPEQHPGEVCFIQKKRNH